MFIVHCSHGATLIFDDVFLYNRQFGANNLFITIYQTWGVRSFDSLLINETKAKIIRACDSSKTHKRYEDEDDFNNDKTVPTRAGQGHKQEQTIVIARHPPPLVHPRPQELP